MLGSPVNVADPDRKDAEMESRSDSRPESSASTETNPDSTETNPDSTELNPECREANPSSVGRHRPQRNPIHDLSAGSHPTPLEVLADVEARFGSAEELVARQTLPARSAIAAEEVPPLADGIIDHLFHALIDFVRVISLSLPKTLE